MGKRKWHPAALLHLPDEFVFVLQQIDAVGLVQVGFRRAFEFGHGFPSGPDERGGAPQPHREGAGSGRKAAQCSKQVRSIRRESPGLGVRGSATVEVD